MLEKPQCNSDVPSDKQTCLKVAQSCPTLCDPMDYTIHGILQARILKGQPFPSPEDLPNPGTEPRSPALQVDSLTAEPQGKSKNTGMGSLSLFQRIFSIQESNHGLLHCRQILYQLSYHGSLCCCCVASVVSDSVRPPRQHTTRLPRPWDSPGKNTGVGCHFLLQCMKVKIESEVAQLFD